MNKGGAGVEDLRGEMEAKDEGQVGPDGKGPHRDARSLPEPVWSLGNLKRQGAG